MLNIIQNLYFYYLININNIDPNKKSNKFLVKLLCYINELIFFNLTFYILSGK